MLCNPSSLIGTLSFVNACTHSELKGEVQIDLYTRVHNNTQSVLIVYTCNMIHSAQSYNITATLILKTCINNIQRKLRR